MSVAKDGFSLAREWKKLYIAAVLAGDMDEVPSLIAEAEHAIELRAGELLTVTGAGIQEREDLSDALYTLHALKG